MQRRVRNEHVHQKIRRNQSIDLNARCTDIIQPHIPLDDELTYQLYQQGRTIGTFQFESPGMQKYLRELHPTVSARTKKPPLPQMFERAPQLRLEYDRQRDKEEGHGLLEKP